MSVFPRTPIQNGSYWMTHFGSREISRLMTIEQLRAARGLLGWSQSELPERAALPLPTVKREISLDPKWVIQNMKYPFSTRVFFRIRH